MQPDDPLARLARRGLTRKKKTLHADERDRPDVQTKRRSFRRKVKKIEPERLVFVDETGVTTAMTPTYAWAPRGERAYASAPGSWESVTLTAALGLDGVRAPLAFPGSTDAATFQTYVEEVLVPALHEGDVVVFDNLSAHLAPAVAEAIERAGASVLPLPPWSPDYTPIEEMYSKVKEIPPPGRGTGQRGSLRRDRGGAEASDSRGHHRLVQGGRPVRNPWVNRSRRADTLHRGVKRLPKCGTPTPDRPGPRPASSSRPACPTRRTQRLANRSRAQRPRQGARI